jgi:hypothetical protein
VKFAEVQRFGVFGFLKVLKRRSAFPTCVYFRFRNYCYVWAHLLHPGFRTTCTPHQVHPRIKCTPYFSYGELVDRRFVLFVSADPTHQAVGDEIAYRGLNSALLEAAPLAEPSDRRPTGKIRLRAGVIGQSHKDAFRCHRKRLLPSPLES